MSIDDFYSLTPSRIIDAVEGVVQKTDASLRATGVAMALNSLENRVYLVSFEGGVDFVAKFYRPGRWTFDQIAEEHLFLSRLEASEIPVVPPLRWETKGKLSSLDKTSEGIYFAVFPRVRGRLCDELLPDQLETLGRYLARIHSVGEIFQCRFRESLDVQTRGWRSLDRLLNSRYMQVSAKAHYENLCEMHLERIEQVFDTRYFQAIHGDCHLGNVLWHDTRPFFIDFDDMVRGPAVQDVWMIVNGRDAESQKNRDRMLRAYESLRPFPYETLGWIESLRALRMIHYAAWIADRYDDPSFPHAFPQFGSVEYWRSECDALQEAWEALSGTLSSDERF